MSSAASAPGARNILDAASRLFADQGFDAVSVAEIAKEAGVSKANIFHHFPSKDDLYLAVMKEASAAHADYAERLAESDAAWSVKVSRLIEFEIRFMFDNRERTRLMLRELSDGHPRVGKLVRKVFRRNFAAVVHIFEEGRRQGEFRADFDPVACAMMMAGAAQSFFKHSETLKEFLGLSELTSPTVYAEQVSRLLLHGIIPPTVHAAEERSPLE